MSMPPDPLTALAEGAAGLNELYMTLQAQGFPEHRAFELTQQAFSTILMASMVQAREELEKKKNEDDH